MHIIRRMLYYRQAQTLKQLQERYLAQEEAVQFWLQQLCWEKEVIEDGGCYYHSKQYERARKQTIRNLRIQAVTQPSHHYAALLVSRVFHNAPVKDQLKDTLSLFCNQKHAASLWETVLSPSRISGYQPELLDQELAQGEYFWKLHPDGMLSFHRYEDIDWEQSTAAVNDGSREMQTEDTQEQRIYQRLKIQGASFLHALNRIPVSYTHLNNMFPTDFPFLNEVSAENFVATPERFFLEMGKDVKEAIKSMPVTAAFKKKDLGKIIGEIFKRYSTEKTSEILDQIKDMGFQYSTVAGAVSYTHLDVYKRQV